MCCALDVTTTFLNKSGVNCRSDGLCADAGNDTLYRTACTDQTWQSSECIKFCINGTNQAGSDVPIMQCSDGSYCCGNKAIDMACCNGGQEVWIVNGEETIVNPSATPSSSLSSTTTSSSIIEVAALAPNTTASASATTGAGKKGDPVAKVGSAVGLLSVWRSSWALVSSFSFTGGEKHPNYHRSQMLDGQKKCATIRYVKLGRLA